MGNILLIGEMYSYNLGDGVICNVVSKLLETELEDVSITIFDMSLKKGYINKGNIIFNPLKKELGYVKRQCERVLAKLSLDINRKRLTDNYDHYQEKLNETIIKLCPDAIVFAGGQMFMDTFIPRIEQTVEIAEKYNIPIFFNACGCGNYMPKEICNSLKKVFDSSVVRAISVRDGFDIIQKLAQSIEVIDTFDTAILTSLFYHPAAKNEKIGIGIMLSKYHDVKMQIAFWKEIVEYCVNSQIEFQLFCNGAPADYGFAEYILKIVGLEPQKYLCKRPQNVEELINLISSYNAILSMRLHSLIIAYAMSVPAVAIAWDQKISAFYQKIENEKYCFTFKNNVCDIYQALELAVNDREYYVKKSDIEKDAKENIICIKEYMQKK